MLILVKLSWSPLLSKFSHFKLTKLDQTWPSSQTNGLSLEPEAFGQSESQFFFFFFLN